jgi:glycosyltransferase involved in cell wall biosynthesis
MNRQLRVLLVLGTSGGGVGRHVHDLAKSLVTEGHSVVIAGPQSTQDSLDLSGTGARFAPVPIAERPSLTGDPRSIRTIRKLAREADVVHAHGLRAGALATLARGKSGPPPLVVTLHNALVSGGAVAAAYARLERIVAHRADLVLGVSADLVESQRRLGARRVGLAVVAAPALRLLRHSAQQTRRELGIAPDRPLLVSVARLTEQKGMPLLLDASALLRDLAEQPIIVVAGDGPSKTVLQQRIDDESLPVRLLGWRDDIPELLGAADVAVSSAVWEGQPIWIQEALGAGCPIVATDVGGTAQVVGDAAVLVPPGDAAALAGAVVAVLRDDVARATLRARALARSYELPDADATRDAALAAYTDLLTATPDDC